VTPRDCARSTAAARRLCGAGAAALLIGIAALAAPLDWPQESTSWDDLLAPYSTGAPLAGSFRIAGIRRGSENDVVISVVRVADGATVQVHVVPRGRWKGVRESLSFGVGYETPHSTAAERDAVTAALFEAIRAHDRGLPSPDAIPLRASLDDGVLPHWLEMLRGGRGLLLGAGIALLGLLILVRAAALGVAGIALGVGGLIARVIGMPALQLGGAWTVPAAVVLIVLALRGRPRAAGADCWLALASGVVALILRLALGPWGPLHVNGYAPRFIDGAARDPAALAAYGPGYVEIFAPLAALAASAPDWPIFAGNVVASALVAPVAFALARLAGVSRPAAAASALLLAIDPVAIRMSATESYFPLIVLLCTSAAVALLLAAGELHAGRRWQASACAIAAALLLTQALRVHPSSWGVAATVPLIALAARSGGVAGRLLVALSSAAMSAGIVVAVSGGALLDVLANMRSGTLMPPLPPPSLWPLLWIALAAGAYAIVAPRPWLALPAALAAAALLMTRQSYWQSWIWQQSYDRLYLTLPVIAVVSLVPARLLLPPWVVFPILLAAFAWLRVGLPIVTARTTDHLEYRWVHDQLAALPQQCRVIYVASAANRGVLLPTYAGSAARPAVAMDLRVPHTVDAALAPAPCLYYVRTSLCSSADGRPACDAIERRLTLAPIARASFAAVPSSQIIGYDTDAVEISLARVEAIDGAPGGRRSVGAAPGRHE
jgi:hypothetical protein